MSADRCYPSIHPKKDFRWKERSIKAEDLIHTHSGNLVAWKLGKSSAKSTQAFQNRARIIRHFTALSHSMAVPRRRIELLDMMLRLMDVRATLSNAVVADKQEILSSSCISALPVP